MIKLISKSLIIENQTTSIKVDKYSSRSLKNTQVKNNNAIK